MPDEFASAACSLAEFGLPEPPARVVEPAVPADAAAIAAVLVASIRDLCEADHHGDGETIARWTRNKTPETVAGWIADPDQDLLVCRLGYAIAAVGAADAHKVLLNYVAPGHRFAGHSAAMLAALEARMRARGATTGHLVSTETAHRFYLSRGWRDDGGPTRHGSLLCWPMTKVLAPAAP